jgi:hypothetical protein
MALPAVGGAPAPPSPTAGYAAGHRVAGFFILTRIFLPLPSGKGIPERYKWYTASYRLNSKFKPKSPIQTVISGIPRYKVFIPLR